MKGLNAIIQEMLANKPWVPLVDRDDEWERFLTQVFEEPPAGGSWFWAGPKAAEILGIEPGWHEIKDERTREPE